MSLSRMMVALFACSPLFAQVAVPFVGCESSGQSEVRAAPKGTRRSVAITAKDAQSLAYYKSADGIGALGPRGWYCEGAWGSGGGVLSLSPKPIANDVSGWRGIDGEVIQIDHMTSAADGRYEVARTMLQVFPQYRDSAARVMELMDFPFRDGPYPTDTLVGKGRSLVEYTTPAQTEGLGNFDSYMGKNDLPIRGAVMLIDGWDGPDALRLSVRLGPDLAGVIPAIVAQFERENTRFAVKGK